MYCWWECKLLKSLWKKSVEDSQTTKNKTIMYDPTIPTPGYIYVQKTMNILLQEDTCRPVFMTALFTTAKIWKQLRSIYQQIILWGGINQRGKD